MRVQFILDAVAEKNEVQVGDAELTEYLVRQAARYDMAPQEFANQVMQGGNLPLLVRGRPAQQGAGRGARGRDRSPTRPATRSTSRRLAADAVARGRRRRTPSTSADHDHDHDRPRALIVTPAANAARFGTPRVRALG